MPPRTARPSAGSMLLRRRLSQHPERYVEIVRVLRKHRLHRLIVQAGLSHQHEDEDAAHRADPETDAYAEGLTSALEELGPCFIKLGQLLSTRPDLLPPAYIARLGRLQDRVAPVPVERVTAIVEDELGAPLSDLFRAFDRRPLATASMAQVHRAVLPDGREVAVKVQRPGVRRRIEIDIEVLREVARLAEGRTAAGARYGVVQMVRELDQSLRQEMDFRQEAENTRLIARLIAPFGCLLTPEVHQERTSQRVLTLGFVDGRHLADLSPEKLAALDADRIARDLLTAYLKQMVVDGVFHCDPHPGNILFTGEGRLALLDFGMVGRFDAGQKDIVIALLLAFSERQGQRVADAYLEMVQVPRGFDRRAFSQDIGGLVSRYHDMSGGRLALGTALLDLTRVAHAHGAPVPTAMTLLGKAMLNLDGTVRVLSPELDPVSMIREYMSEVMQGRVRAQASPGRTFALTLDMKHLVENAPRRADAILEKLANDALTLRLEVNELERLTRRLERATGRVAAGVVLGSLIMAGGYMAGSMARAAPRRRLSARRR